MQLVNTSGTERVRDCLVSTAETTLFWGIVSQYIFYFLGLAAIAPLLIAWPVILLCLSAILVHDRGSVRWVTLLWMICFVGLLAVGLLNFYLNGFGGTYLARWPLAFGLAAFLPLVGSLIRAQVIYRAAAVLGVQTLVYSIAAAAAMATGFNVSYSVLPAFNVLPFEYFSVSLWAGEVATGEVRVLAFTPYATYAGAVACFYAIACVGEKSGLLRWLGLSGWLILCVLSSARAALVCLAAGAVCYALSSLRKRILGLAAGVTLLLVAVTLPILLGAMEHASYWFEQLRPTSSQVRANLKQIAFDEWMFGGSQFFGIGQSVPGGTVVAEMPVGTHDTISANLLIRGIIGLHLILLPLLVTFVFGCFAGRSRKVRAGIVATMMLLLYTFAENLEGILSYCWPGLLLVGAMCNTEEEQVPATLRE